MSVSPGVAPRATRMSRQDRREQLLDAARAVFVASGYHAAAMDDIAERAGVSKPVLYQHFPGKLDLYLALLDRHAAELELRVRTAMSETSDNRARVRAAFEAYFDFVGGEGQAFRLVLESDLRSDPRVRERVEDSLSACIDPVAEVIAVDTGTTPERAHLLAVGLVGMAEVSARNWLDGNSGVSREEAVRLLATLAWRGISGFPRHNDTSGAGQAGTAQE